MSPEAHVGVVSAGIGLFYQRTELETVDHLIGKSYNFGFTGGAAGYLGVTQFSKQVKNMNMTLPSADK